MRTVTFLCLAGCSGISEKADTGDTDGGGLTEEMFADQFLDRYCAELLACANVEPCPLVEGTTTGTEPCAFDPVAAQACLDGTWTCNTDFPGYEYLELSEICFAVCGDAGTTGTATTATTTTP